MEKKINEIEQIKIALIAIVIAFLILATGFGVVTKNGKEHLRQKDLQINSLIDEIGDLKVSNDNLYQKLNQEDENLEKLYLDLYENKNNLLNGKKTLEQTLTDQKKQFQTSTENFQNTQGDLQKQLQKKEQIISELAKKNNEMKQELSVPKFNDKTVDILILGQNKGLTDTILLLMINPDNQKMTVVSIPRDLSYRGRKINELEHAYGIEKLQEAIYKITNVYPDKYVLWDFNAFVKLIDILGGIDIEVEKNITDNAYPGANNSYIVVKFTKGLQHMDGETALKYARSRESTSDFDRSKRQQQIILAVKEKAKQINILGNLQLVGSIFESIKSHIKTDITAFEALSYYEKYSTYTYNGGNTINTQNLLTSSKNISGQYILLPKGKNYTGIKEYIAGLVK